MQNFKFVVFNKICINFTASGGRVVASSNLVTPTKDKRLKIS